jgi:DNA-binding GntR family transcriptional regulator
MSTRLNLAPRGETLGANVLLQIKELLLGGQLMPGEQLSLRSMAEALGVSVMPVRAAVYQLVADQALEVAPNRSVRVPTMTADQFREITAIRLQIEGYAVEEAALRVTPSLVQSLRELNAALSEAMTRADTERSEIVRLNKDLHFSVYETAGMPMLIKIIETLWLRIGPVLNYDLRAGSERTEKRIAVEHHARMIDALADGDAEAARSALRSDIDSAFQHILAKQFS